MMFVLMILMMLEMLVVVMVMVMVMVMKMIVRCVHGDVDVDLVDHRQQVATQRIACGDHCTSSPSPSPSPSPAFIHLYLTITSIAIINTITSNITITSNPISIITSTYIVKCPITIAKPGMVEGPSAPAKGPMSPLVPLL